MKTLAPLLALALASPIPALAAAPATSGPAECALVEVIARLADGPELRIERADDRAAVRDARAGEDVLVASCAGLEVAPTTRRPTRAEPSVTEILRDARGEVVLVRATTAFGTRVTVIEAGHVNRDGLHVIAFDNDDVHVSDGRGALLYQRQTLPDGTLVERDGTTTERRTAPDGRVTVVPASR